jgi:hypothetical protein
VAACVIESDSLAREIAVEHNGLFQENPALQITVNVISKGRNVPTISNEGFFVCIVGCHLRPPEFSMGL